MFRAAGYDRACRSPGSGAIRPYGAGDMSPWPGDLAFTGPFMVEVKYDERVWNQGGGKTWIGSTFIRKTLRDLDKLAARRVIGKPRPIPVLFARSNLKPWRVFVRAADLDNVLFDPPFTFVQFPGHGEWAEIPPDVFFDLFPARFDDARTEESLAHQS
jgi:hypothetical protein